MYPLSGTDINGSSNFINMTRYLLFGANTFFLICSNIYVRTKINFNLYIFGGKNFTTWGEAGGGGDINANSNFINLARYPYLC